MGRQVGDRLPATSQYGEGSALIAVLPPSSCHRAHTHIGANVSSASDLCQLCACCTRWSTRWVSAAGRCLGIASPHYVSRSDHQAADSTSNIVGESGGYSDPAAGSHRERSRRDRLSSSLTADLRYLLPSRYGERVRAPALGRTTTLPAPGSAAGGGGANQSLYSDLSKPTRLSSTDGTLSGHARYVTVVPTLFASPRDVPRPSSAIVQKAGDTASRLVGEHLSGSGALSAPPHTIPDHLTFLTAGRPQRPPDSVQPHARCTCPQACRLIGTATR